MARHVFPPNHTAKRALIVLATASAALGVGAATASADTARLADVPWRPPTSFGATAPQAALQGATSGLQYATVPVQALRYTPVGVTSRRDDGGDVSDFTGPLVETGTVGAVPTLERTVGGLLGGGAA
ncbi:MULTISPECIES: hypothetical protein [Streptomyces]|uniref:hypothetical protein n=1 Tax=Streptomyces TaxID=1883 RepID=UPI0004CCF5A3|nr:hypothetical protein [Streptomyces durhamensis]